MTGYIVLAVISALVIIVLLLMQVWELEERVKVLERKTRNLADWGEPDPTPRDPVGRPIAQGKSRHWRH